MLNLKKPKALNKCYVKFTLQDFSPGLALADVFLEIANGKNCDWYSMRELFQDPIQVIRNSLLVCR